VKCVRACDRLLASIVKLQVIRKVPGYVVSVYVLMSAYRAPDNYYKAIVSFLIFGLIF
jgi:hypothetical protein